MFFIKKNSDDDKKSYLFDRFFVSNQNFTTENVKVIKDSFSKFLKFQVFPGKVATLISRLNKEKHE